MTFARKWNKQLGASMLTGGVAGVTLGFSWLVPGSVMAAMLGWIAVIAIVQCARLKQGSTLALAICGASFYLISGYWFLEVVESFTETSLLMSALLSAGYLFWHVAQFVLFAFCYRRLPGQLDSIALRMPLAWVTVEYLWPRQFPWLLGNTQLGFPLLAQFAEISGVAGVSFLLMFFAQSLVETVTEKNKKAILLVAVGAFAGVLVFGGLRTSALNLSDTKTLAVGVVQVGGVSQRKSLDSESRSVRLQRYSEDIAPRSELLVWPERSLSVQVHESIGNRKNDSRLPSFRSEVPLLAGAQTYRPPKKKFNSALFIDKDGAVPVPYHKRVLMPFGEYLPLPHLFTKLGLGNLLPESEYVAGENPVVFRFTPRSSTSPVTVAPFICYEDLKPELSQLAVEKQASLMVDLSAGGWVAGALPLLQHQTLAAFRAIETRRSLLRVSANGPTSLISPDGRVTNIFEAGEEEGRVVNVPMSDMRPLSGGWSHFFDAVVSTLTILCIILRLFSSLIPTSCVVSGLSRQA